MTKDFDESKGVWRTINHNHVFIKTGQSLSDAMKESGKFNVKGEPEDAIQRTIEGIAGLRRDKASELRQKLSQEEYNKYLNDRLELTSRAEEKASQVSPELKSGIWHDYWTKLYKMESKMQHKINKRK